MRIRVISKAIFTASMFMINIHATDIDNRINEYLTVDTLQKVCEDMDSASVTTYLEKNLDAYRRFHALKRNIDSIRSELSDKNNTLRFLQQYKETLSSKVQGISPELELTQNNIARLKEKLANRTSKMKEKLDQLSEEELNNLKKILDAEIEAEDLEKKTQKVLMALNAALQAETALDEEKEKAKGLQTQNQSINLQAVCTEWFINYLNNEIQMLQRKMSEFLMAGSSLASKWDSGDIIGLVIKGVLPESILE